MQQWITESGTSWSPTAPGPGGPPSPAVSGHHVERKMHCLIPFIIHVFLSLQIFERQSGRCKREARKAPIYWILLQMPGYPG